MTHLGPCLESWPKEAYKEVSPCYESRYEITDVFAYRKFAASSWQSGSASAVLVAFHNLVTASISKQFLDGDRRRYYCIKQVNLALQKNVALKMNDTSFGRSDYPISPVVEGVAGLGSYHRLVDCTSAFLL